MPIALRRHGAASVTVFGRSAGAGSGTVPRACAGSTAASVMHNQQYFDSDGARCVLAVHHLSCPPDFRNSLFSRRRTDVPASALYLFLARIVDGTVDERVEKMWTKHPLCRGGQIVLPSASEPRQGSRRGNETSMSPQAHRSDRTAQPHCRAVRLRVEKNYHRFHRQAIPHMN
jgi:hypothetical protein